MRGGNDEILKLNSPLLAGEGLGVRFKTAENVLNISVSRLNIVQFFKQIDK